MNNVIEELMDVKVTNCKKALEDNHIKTYIVRNKEEACHLVSSFINDGEQVCDGGSMTLSDAGIITMLEQRNIQFHTHGDTQLSREESDKEARKAFYADTFITSSNAITMQGELINVDGHGNRVSAMIYGPRQVIVVAGYNKITEDEAAAIQRIRSVAAPANCMRLNKQTPCRILGSCHDCRSMDRICCAYVKLNYDREDRLRVILVKEALGY